MLRYRFSKDDAQFNFPRSRQENEFEDLQTLLQLVGVRPSSSRAGIDLGPSREERKVGRQTLELPVKMITGVDRFGGAVNKKPVCSALRRRDKKV